MDTQNLHRRLTAGGGGAGGGEGEIIIIDGITTTKSKSNSICTTTTTTSEQSSNNKSRRLRLRRKRWQKKSLFLSLSCKKQQISVLTVCCFSIILSVFFFYYNYYSYNYILSAAATTTKTSSSSSSSNSGPYDKQQTGIATPGHNHYKKRRSYNETAMEISRLLSLPGITTLATTTGTNFSTRSSSSSSATGAISTIHESISKNDRLLFDNNEGSSSSSSSRVIHIVNTRFMQEQGQLRTLAMARYYQFVTFCLPTMVKQTTQNFFWIIKTDPNLEGDVLDLMVKALSVKDNFYLVASNNNFLINKKNGSWRGGEEGLDILESKIYTGNLTRLHQAIVAREKYPILETRLDADDGLHPYYIKYLQYRAKEYFFKNNNNNDDNDDDNDDGDNDSNDKENDGEEDNNTNQQYSAAEWMHFCIRRHLEWHPQGNNKDDSSNKSNNTSTQQRPGVLVAIEHKKICITPGMTVGFNRGVQLEQVPIYPHDVLYKKLSQKKKKKNNSTAIVSDCYPNNNGHLPLPQLPTDGHDDHYHGKKLPILPCLDMAEEFILGAIRSRAWTSAGMQRVVVAGGGNGDAASDGSDGGTVGREKKKKSKESTLPKNVQEYNRNGLEVYN